MGENVQENLKNELEVLKLNRYYQSLLKSQLYNVEQALKRNKELQKLVQSDFAKGKRSKPLLSNGSTTLDEEQDLRKISPTSYFMDPQGQQPPLNQDAIRKREENIIVFHGKHKKWSEQEIETLRSAVRQQNQQLILNRLYERYTSDGTLSDFEREVQKIKDMSDEELEQNVDDIDWDLISRSSLPHRSDVDCQIQWRLHCDRNVNHSDWTQEEDQRLKELFNTENPDLEEIADSLGTNRTPLQCYLRYQNKLVSKPSKSKWTPEEDRILTEAVKNYGEKNWQQVAHFLEGRTGQQCLHRWLKTLNPGIRRGKWSEEEDKRLTLAIAAYGSKNWTKVQRHVPGRTDVQCRERWVNILDPNLKNESWTPEEDQKLIEAVKKCEKGKWSKVAALCFPRTDNQCWRRWKSLTRKKLKKEGEDANK